MVTAAPAIERAVTPTDVGMLDAVMTMREMQPAHRANEVKPLSPERFKIQFTIGRETYEKFRQVQNLLRHSVPDGDPAIIFERALNVLVTSLERRKTAATERPRPADSTRASPRARSNAASRHIPAAVKRTVWRRDAGRCAFKGRQGRCGEVGFLEYHHVVPFATGGDSSAENIELRCRAHNGYEAEQYFRPIELPLLREG